MCMEAIERTTRVAGVLTEQVYRSMAFKTSTNLILEDRLLTGMSRIVYCSCAMMCYLLFQIIMSVFV